MFTYKKGDILKEDTEAIVNTVNTVGVMGKGIALQFKEQYPDNYRQYKKACDEGEVQIGQMFVTGLGSLLNPKYIINFPTKKHWRNPSKMEYITEGLKDLINVIEEKEIQSIALPPLGCGNGGLDWSNVKHEIERHLSKFKDVEIVLFEPSTIAYEKSKQEKDKDVNLTANRAMLLSLFKKYKELGFGLSFIEAHKLIYFLQRFGEPLELSFDQNRYGPYCHTIDHMLYDLEGSYIKGTKFKDAKPQDEIELQQEKFDDINTFIEKNLEEDQKSRLKNVHKLIEGFESPLGMELLATVDYVIKSSGNIPDFDRLINAIYNWGGDDESWGKRKKEIMKEEYVQLAKKRLMEFKGDLYMNLMEPTT